MKSSTVTKGVILLILGILLSFVGNAMYESDKADYIRSLLPSIYGYTPFTPSQYQSLMNFDEGLMYLGIILVIISFVVMWIGASRKDSEDKKKERNRCCPNCGRFIPFDASICPYCGKKFKDSFSSDENVKTQTVVEVIEKVDKKENEVK